MLYAPKLLLPSQHLHQLQECLVTSHLPGPNILGMCKGIRMLYLEGCACLVKTTKRQRARLGRGDDILSTIYTYDVYKQLYKHVYIYYIIRYTYYICTRIQYLLSIHLSRIPGLSPTVENIYKEVPSILYSSFTISDAQHFTHRFFVHDESHTLVGHLVDHRIGG